MDKKFPSQLLNKNILMVTIKGKMGKYKTESQYRNDIIEICKRVYANDWVASNDGNISIKISPNEVLCTPTGMSKGYLTPDQLVKVDMDGNKLEGSALKESSEVKMHVDVYKHKKGTNAAVHAHPPYATAHAVAGIPLDQCVIPEIISSLGSIPLAKYGTPSTHEVPKNIRKHLQDYNAFLMENHGAFTIGADVYQAYYRMESMELFARISLLAQTLGNVNNISEENVRKIMEMRSNYIKDDNGLAGCKIGDKFITTTEGIAAVSGNKGNGGLTAGDEENITIKKSELVNLVSKIVINIVNKNK